MTWTVDDERILGEVLCRHHADEVDLLCMHCLARAHVPASAEALEHDGERFLGEHRHGCRVPDHAWYG